MRFQSPLSNLCDVLGQIKESARQYRDTLISNEAATRAVLIDPVLRALGWDTANTNMVEVEKTLGREVRADYALYDNNATTKIVVEAKALGANLNHRPLFMNLVQYAFSFRLNDIFLTDGLTWLHFDNFQPGHEAPSKILDLANDDVVACAAYLVQHLDAAQFWPVDQNIDVLASRIDQMESAVATIQKDVAMALRAIQAAAVGAPPPDLPPAPIPNQPSVSFVELGAIEDAVGRRPTQLRLPDGVVLSVRGWQAVLRECCKFVLSNNPGLPIPFPDCRGMTVELIRTVKPPPTHAFAAVQYNGQTVYIYHTYDPNSCVRNARYILEKVTLRADAAPAA
jgi:hypothetical protein